MADPVVPVVPAAVVATPPAAPAAPVVDAKADAFAALAAKEKDYVSKTQKLATEREAFKAEQARLAIETADYQRWKLAKAQRLVNPEAYLKEDFGEGWYDKLTEYRLNGGKTTPEFVAASVDERLAAFEKKQADERAATEKAATEAAQKAHQEAWQKFQDDTAAFVKGQPDAYELINAYGLQGRVVAVIQETYEKTLAETGTGRILNAKEAADLVEADLLDRSTKAKKLTKAPPPPNGEPKPPTSAQPRTLTSALTAITTPPAPEGPLTEDERMQRAIAKGEAVRKARQLASA